MKADYVKEEVKPETQEGKGTCPRSHTASGTKVRSRVLLLTLQDVRRRETPGEVGTDTCFHRRRDQRAGIR